MCWSDPYPTPYPTTPGDEIQRARFGDDRFAEEVMARAGRRERRAVSLDEVLGAVCAQLGITEQALAVPGKGRESSQARALIAWALRQLPELSLQEAAQRLGRDISRLSAAATTKLVEVAGGADRQLPRGACRSQQAPERPPEGMIRAATKFDSTAAP